MSFMCCDVRINHTKCVKIAIIGGIGSGKSEVLGVARDMGLACLSADEINRELLTSPEYIAKLEEAFPYAVKDGEVLRAALASRVFSDGGERAKLNALAHPRILTRISEAKENPLVVEMPLLVEIGASGLFDEIVLVTAPMELRLNRLEARGLDREDAIRRISAQASEDELKAVATRVIDNSGGREALRKNAENVLCEILKCK